MAVDGPPHMTIIMNYHITLAIILLCSLFVETKTESPFLLFWCEVNYSAPVYLLIIQISPICLFTRMAQR